MDSAFIPNLVLIVHREFEQVELPCFRGQQRDFDPGKVDDQFDRPVGPIDEQRARLQNNSPAGLQGNSSACETRKMGDSGIGNMSDLKDPARAVEPAERRSAGGYLERCGALPQHLTLTLADKTLRCRAAPDHLTHLLAIRIECDDDLDTSRCLHADRRNDRQYSDNDVQQPLQSDSHWTTSSHSQSK